MKQQMKPEALCPPPVFFLLVCSEGNTENYNSAVCMWVNSEMCGKLIVKAVFSLTRGCCVFVLVLDQVTNSISSSQNFLQVVLLPYLMLLFFNSRLVKSFIFLMFGVHGCKVKLLLCSDNILDAGHSSNFKHEVVSLSWNVANISCCFWVSSISYFQILTLPAHLLEITAFPSL